MMPREVNQALAREFGLSAEEYGRVLAIMGRTPSLTELERRLRTRDQDSDEVIAKRMQKSRDEISHWAEYDYVLVNDDLDATEADLRAILAAERLRRDRRPALGRFVRTLMEEAR